MTVHAVTEWTPQAAGHELAAQLTAHHHPGQGWEITNAPETLHTHVHALVWFAEQMGCELVCPSGAHWIGPCTGHMPHNPQPGERIIMGTRGVGPRVVYRVTENHGHAVILVEERAA
jgi:hypothetical protein